mmetsp:Transcript_51424/g.138549  ORF Transcript_51424/g.138549 Transcript_51424/m.138549 type:complete len:392 (+) Transcript_51424:91-1266(+)
MPIYEEKLICPLAIRFTQQHIRPTFQDGHETEETIAQIKVRPGSGEYDCILEAPFPNIEIVRWYPQGVRGSELEDVKHWYSLDNRRLYCLQRAAAAQWPRRVAAVAEGLYAATDGIWRKDDSATSGFAVAIGHSPKMVLSQWDWRKEVPDPEAPIPLSVVHGDDLKGKVADLTDAPAPPSMLDLFFQEEEAGGPLAAPPAAHRGARGALGFTGCEEGSTSAGGSSPRSHPSNDLAAAGQLGRPGSSGPPQGLFGLRRALVGQWQGEQGEIYDVKFKGGGTWAVGRTDADGGTKRFTLCWDEESQHVWWGVNWALYLDAEACHLGQLRWLPGDAWGSDAKPKARFSWHRSTVAHTAGDQKVLRNPTARVKAARVAMERREMRAQRGVLSVPE